MPRRIQFDNGSPFTAPTGVGELVKVCLHQGATPVFVPPREPWRCGTIEHLNDSFDRRFFRHERFGDLDQPPSAPARSSASTTLGTAYHYVTATLDLALAENHNLLVGDSDGQLITVGRLPRPRR